MNVELMDITPAKAKEWLKLNNNNRPKKPRQIERLTSAITRGEWEINGDTIKFNGDETLIDGQNRLEAIIRSGCTVSSWVASGLKESCFDTLDQITPRSLADVLSRMGEKYPQYIASAILNVYTLDEAIVAQNGGLRITTGLEILKHNEQLRRSTKFIHDHIDGPMLPRGVAISLHYLMWKKEPDTADAFWSGVLCGEGLVKGSPALVYRNVLLKSRERTKDRPMTKSEKMALAIIAWGHVRQDAPCNRLRWNASREEFPRII